MLEFGSKFVDHKQRQLSLQAFAEVNKVDLAFPRVKIAMLIRAYRKQPNITWCPLPETAWFSVAKRQTTHKLDAVLHYFQSLCKPAVAGMQSLKLAALTANVACGAADAFILCKEAEQEGQAMMSAVAKNFDEIKLFAESQGRDPPPPKPEQAWLDFDEMKKRNTDNAAVADKEPPNTPAKCDHVRPSDRGANQRAGRQGCSRSGETIATVPWQEWYRGRVAQHLC